MKVAVYFVSWERIKGTNLENWWTSCVSWATESSSLKWIPGSCSLLSSPSPSTVTSTPCLKAPMPSEPQGPPPRVSRALTEISSHQWMDSQRDFHFSHLLLLSVMWRAIFLSPSSTHPPVHQLPLNKTFQKVSPVQRNLDFHFIHRQTYESVKQALSKESEELHPSLCCLTY